MHVPRERTHEEAQKVTRRTSVKRKFSYDTPFGKILDDDLRKESKTARYVEDESDIYFELDPALPQSGLPAGMIPPILRERFPRVTASLTH
jgi:hypothetical protein